MSIGLYFSHIDWNDPNFRWDMANRSFDPAYNPKDNPKDWQAFIEREREQLREIFSNYGQIDQMFFDGTWFGLAWDEMIDIVKMCRKLQPHCLFNDRGIGAYGDFTSPERWIPSAGDDSRMSERNAKVWQVCDPIATSWAYLPGDTYKPKKKLLHNFVDAIAKGGTYVFAVAPMSNGTFPQDTIDTLEYMGDWLKLNGDAIYKTRAWKKNQEEKQDIFFTCSKDEKQVYIINFGIPEKSIVINDLSPLADSDIILLGTGDKVKWALNDNTLSIELSSDQIDKIKSETAISFKVDIK
jgi:alpha-L-fucosidase